MTEYLDLADYLLIAEAVTGIPAETLGRLPRLDLAESALHAPQAEFGGVEFYPDFVVKAAVLCSRLLRNHPLPDGTRGPPGCHSRSSSSATVLTGIRLRWMRPSQSYSRSLHRKCRRTN